MHIQSTPQFGGRIKSRLATAAAVLATAITVPGIVGNTGNQNPVKPSIPTTYAETISPDISHSDTSNTDDSLVKAKKDYFPKHGTPIPRADSQTQLDGRGEMFQRETSYYTDNDLVSFHKNATPIPKSDIRREVTYFTQDGEQLKKTKFYNKKDGSLVHQFITKSP